VDSMAATRQRRSQRPVLHHTRVTAKLRETQRLALVRKTPLGHGEAPLCAPQLEVVASKFSNHADLHIAKVRFERLVLGPSCGDSMANPSNRSLPESVEPRAKGIDCATLVPKPGISVCCTGRRGHGTVGRRSSFLSSKTARDSASLARAIRMLLFDPKARPRASREPDLQLLPPACIKRLFRY